MKFPSKTEIVAIRFREKGYSYDFTDLLNNVQGIYLYHKPVLLLKTDTWTEGAGETRGKFIYHYYLCRRRAIPIVLFNICKTYIISRIFATHEASKGNNS